MGSTHSVTATIEPRKVDMLRVAMETGAMLRTKKVEILEVREMRETKKLIGRES